MQINTIGEKAAILIMAFRETETFETIEDITKIKRISQKRFEKIADQITV